MRWVGVVAAVVLIVESKSVCLTSCFGARKILSEDGSLGPASESAAANVRKTTGPGLQFGIRAQPLPNPLFS